MTSQTLSTPILSLHNHTINRGDCILCQGINLQLNTGQVCHVIGENGTGKTTLLMQLAGLLPISVDINNNIENDNNTTSEIRYYGNIGLPTQPVYLSHQLGIHPDLTVEQNLQFLLNLYNITPTENDCQQALSWVGLDGYEQTPCHQLSAGQTRRVNLARLHLMTTSEMVVSESKKWGKENERRCINNTSSEFDAVPRINFTYYKLWLLDEPFTALDVAMIAKLQQRIKEFAHNGGAVLMTSHQMANMDSLADFELNLSEFMYV